MEQFFITLSLMLVALSNLASTSPTNVITVANGQVDVKSDGLCSLFEAIENAESSNGSVPHPDCAAGVLGPDIIMLASNGSYLFSSRAPSFNSVVTIEGSGAELDHLSSGFFEVGTLGSLTLRNITLQGSNGALSPVLALGDLHIENSTLRENIAAGSGGAVSIRAFGTSSYSFVDVTFTNNVADVSGGAIDYSTISEGMVTVLIDSAEFNSNGRWVSAGATETNNGGAISLTNPSDFLPAFVTISNSTFSNNFGSSGGGAIYISDSVELVIKTTTLDSNETTSQGGALRNRFGTVVIEQSTLSNNAVSSDAGINGGGAIHNFKGSVSLTNSTVSGNQAARGGGIYSSATDVINNSPAVIILNHVTLTNNTASLDGFGGAIYNWQRGDIEARVNAQNSLILGNTTSLSNFDCRNEDGTMVSFGYNVKSGSALAGCSFSGGTGDVSVPDAASAHIAATLADNGGTTLTHQLTSGSAARNLIPNGTNGCSASAVDQRNRLRQSGNAGTACDSGAYEWGASLTPTAVGLASQGTVSNVGLTIIIVLLSATILIGLTLLTKRSQSCWSRTRLRIAATSSTKIQLALLLLALLFVQGAGQRPVAAATITVTTNADSGPGSLRQALLDSADNDTITFSAGLQDAKILLASNLPPINHTLTIDGAGRNVAISGAEQYRSGFTINVNGVLNATSIDLINGRADQGGAVLNRGSLLLTNVFMENNATPDSTPSYQGGAIYSSGAMRLTSTIIEESASNIGGAIYSTGSVQMSGGTLSNNSAALGGALVIAGSRASLGGVSFFDNVVSNTGGAIHSSNSEVTCTGCAMNDNSATAGGGTFYVDPVSTLVISSTVIAGGSAENGGTLYNLGTTTMRGGSISDVTANINGGAVYNLGDFTAEADANINSASTAIGKGGGIHNQGTVLLDGAILEANSSLEGAHIFNGGSGQLTLRATTLKRGIASNAGGGLMNMNSADISHSTFSDNRAANAAGLFNALSGSLNLTNVTFSNNDADKYGGAIISYGTLNANNVTAANNSAPLGGAAYYGANALIQNSLFADSTAGLECVKTSGTLAIFYTLVADASCDALAVPANGNRAGDPALAALADNGGATETHAISTGSIAIGGGALASCSFNDQRGYLRHGTGCDMGAYEISDGLCASWDGTTERITMDSGAVGTAVASLSTAGQTVKVAGNCVGATIGVGGVDHLLWMPVDAIIEGGHSALRWNNSADSGTNPTILDADQQGRVAILNTLAAGIFRHVTLQNGLVAAHGAGIFASATSSLQLEHVVLTNNRTSLAMRNGGGIYMAGNTTLSVTNSDIANNSANLYGGGIYFDDGIALISNSTLRNNIASSKGGGVYGNNGALRMLYSTFTENSTGTGGPFYMVAGSTELRNSTISANGGVGGSGGYVAGGSADFVNSTIAFGGSAIFDAPGLYIGGSGRLANMIVSSNSGGDDCELGAGAAVTIVDSLIEDGSCINAGQAGNIDGEPLLAALADNGGRTLTHSLLANSPARDAGNSIDCPNDDQRGVLRSFGACDMGAYELEAAPTAVQIVGWSAGVRQQWFILAGLLSLLLLSWCYRPNRHLAGKLTTVVTKQKENEP